jgi:hypothetical protein
VIQALGVKRTIHRAGRRALPLVQKQLCEEFGIAATTFKTWSMPCRKSCYFIEEEQFRVVATPHIALAILEFEDATDPLPRCPTSARNRPIGGVKLAATIAHQCSARRSRNEFAEGGDAVLQWH